MNFQLSYPATLAQVIPYSTLAAGGVWLPSPEVTVTSIFMNSLDASKTSGFNDIRDGTIRWTQLETRHRLDSLPGGITFADTYAFEGDFSGHRGDQHRSGRDPDRHGGRCMGPPFSARSGMEPARDVGPSHLEKPDRTGTGSCSPCGPRCMRPTERRTRVWSTRTSAWYF